MAGPSHFNSGINTPQAEISNLTAMLASILGLECVINMLTYAHVNVASAATILSLSSEKPFIRITGSTATALHGISKTGSKNVLIFNATDKKITYKNSSTDPGVDPEERISTPTGFDLEQLPNTTVGWIKDPVTNLWVIQSGSSSGGGGGGGFNVVVPRTASATIASNEDCTVVDASGGNITLTLPPVVVGEPHTFIRTDSSSNTVTIQRAGSNQILNLLGLVNSDTLPSQGSILKLTGITSSLWGSFS